MTTDNEELPDNPLQSRLDQLEAKYGEAASPRDGETDEEWYIRMQTSRMLYATDRADLHDLRAVRELKAAEAAGLVIDIRDEEPPEPVTRAEAEQVLNDPELRAARVKEYLRPDYARADRAAQVLTGRVVPNK